jgi:hypothetical protein
MILGLLLALLPGAVRADLIFIPEYVEKLNERARANEYDHADQYCAGKEAGASCAMPGTPFEGGGQGSCRVAVDAEARSVVSRCVLNDPPKIERGLPDGPWRMSDRDCRWADQTYLQRENGTCDGEPIAFDRFCAGMTENSPCTSELTANGASTSFSGHCLRSVEVLEGRGYRSKSRNVVLCQPDHPVPHDIGRSKPPNP